MVVRSVAREIHEAFDRASVQQKVRGFMVDEPVWESAMAARDSKGKYVEKVSKEELLYHFKSGKRPFYSATEIAEEFEIERETAHRRLEELAEKGDVEKIKMGERSVVWWHPRDAVVLSRNGCDEITAMDTTTEIASQGETRAEALKMIADAIELEQEAVEDHSVEPSVPDGPWTKE